MRNERGFTLAETMITLAVSAVVFSTISRPIATYLGRSRARSAASVVAGDLDLARSIALRQRQPVRLAFNSLTSTYTIQTRSGSTVFRTVSLGTTTDYHVNSASFAPATVDFYPNGVVSSALTVTLVSGTATRKVTLSRVGMVRIP